MKRILICGSMISMVSILQGETWTQSDTALDRLSIATPWSWTAATLPPPIHRQWFDYPVPIKFDHSVFKQEKGGHQGGLSILAWENLPNNYVWEKSDLRTAITPNNKITTTFTLPNHLPDGANMILLHDQYGEPIWVPMPGWMKWWIGVCIGQSIFLVCCFAMLFCYFKKGEKQCT